LIIQLARAVSNLYDQSLKENHADQATQATKPILCTKAEKSIIDII